MVDEQSCSETSFRSFADVFEIVASWAFLRSYAPLDDRSRVRDVRFSKFQSLG